MTHNLNSSKANHFHTPVTVLLNGVKKGFLFVCGFALVLMLQVTFFSSGAIASPLASIDSQVDKAADFTKENIGKAKDMAKDAKGKIGEGVEKTKQMAGDRANEVKENTKDLSDKAGNKVEGVIDSVKNFLGQ